MGNSTPSFNLTAEALRNTFVLYVDVSQQTGAWSPTAAIWEPQGYKTEEAAMEFNPDKSTVTDILGDTYTDVNKFERAMTIDPNTLRPTGVKGKLNEIVHEITRRNKMAELSQFKVLLVYGYIGDTTDGFAADIYPDSTITPNSLGGSSRTQMPYDIDFGGTAIFGTVDKVLPDPTFTPEA